MFVRVSGNFWYKLEHHRTRRNDYTTGESDFGRFYENEAVSHPKLNIAWSKKAFFQTLRGFVFGLQIPFYMFFTLVMHTKNVC